MESFAVAPDLDVAKIRGFMTRAMTEITRNLRQIEALGTTHERSEVLFERAGILLETIFCETSAPTHERLTWVREGIAFLRGSFMAAEYLPERGTEYMQSSPLQVALYGDLLKEWAILHQAAYGEGLGRNQLTKFETALARHYNLPQGEDPTPAQRFTPPMGFIDFVEFQVMGKYIEGMVES